jgi:hypothetical protein
VSVDCIVAGKSSSSGHVNTLTAYNCDVKNCASTSYDCEEDLQVIDVTLAAVTSAASVKSASNLEFDSEYMSIAWRGQNKIEIPHAPTLGQLVECCNLDKQEDVHAGTVM